MHRKLLIVDDSNVNRRILREILSREYAVTEAGNGAEALERLRSEPGFSAVLLDLVMPEMDGYETLARLRCDEDLAQIPVIITTGNTEESAEVKALSLGANDFVTKPYNPEVIRHRLWNTINLRETAAMVNAARRDELTGLLNRRAFFERAAELIAGQEAGYYVLACFDVDNFKVINDQYGTEKGDEVLRQLAEIFRAGFEPDGGICCRVSADNFAVLYPSTFLKSEKLEEIRRQAGELDGSIQPISFSIGRYLVEDPALPISAMYDRASLAEQSVKGLYDAHIARYDESMRQHLLRQQKIVTEMYGALRSGQFEVWLQPQYNHASGALVGAEALVRWRHPSDGLLVPPGDFVPIFERNGFIYEMDRFVWEETCRLLRRWLDGGGKALPVSVNVSRYDLFREDFYDVLTGLVERYRLPVGLLRLEITESAFAQSSEQIVAMVRRLVDFGFTIEIDDFGSGYSSLNTLKNVPAHILKLDMRFLEDDDGTGRGGSILESVVRMAKWLGMPVIAEGVETRAQADFLKSIGCYYVQGYFYGRPMPAEEYEALAADSRQERRMRSLETAPALDRGTFWNPESLDTLIFNSFVGGACLMELRGGATEVLRVNEKYLRALGFPAGEETPFAQLNPERYLDAPGRRAFRRMLSLTDEAGGEQSGLLRLTGTPDGEVLLHAAVRVAARTNGSRILCCSVVRLSAADGAEPAGGDESRRGRIEEQRRELLDNLPCGAGLYDYDGETLSIVYLNRQYRVLVGRDVQADGTASALDAVHPDDRPALLLALGRAVRDGGDASHDLRIRHGEAGYRSYHLFGRVIRREDGRCSLYVTYTPISDERRSLQELLPLALAAMMESSTDLAFVKDRELRYICCSRVFARMVGLESERDVVGKTDYELFADRALAEKYRADDLHLLESGESLIDLVEQIPGQDGVPRYSSTSKYLLHDAADHVIGLYGVGRDITEYRTAFDQLRLLNETIPGGLASFELLPKGLRVLYFNEGFYAFSGYSREEYGAMVAEDPLALVAPADRPAILSALEGVRRGGQGALEVTFRCRDRGGATHWFSLKAAQTEEGDARRVLNAVQFEITGQKEAEERLRMSEEQYRLALRHSGGILCRYDVADRSVNMTPEVAELFGMPERVADVPHGPVRDGRVAPESVGAYTRFYEEILRGGRTGGAEFRVRTADDWRWMRARYSTIFSDTGAPVYAVVSFVDITDQRRREEELLQNERVLQKRSETDGTTGVYNKTTVEELIRVRLRESPDGPCALLMADLDDLKAINDTLGHPEGDRAIRLLSDALRTQFRRTDLVGRVGGDEFVVFLEGVGDRAQLTSMLTGLFRRLETGRLGPNDAMPLRASVGVAVCAAGGVSFDELYRQADGALYRAKRGGKNRFAFWEAGEKRG